MSSAMRNAVQRRKYRERAQPVERKKLGLLEKHKDYALRAADFASKKKALRALRAKAEERNEDEFYFGMMSRMAAHGGAGVGGGAGRGKRWDGTVLGDRGNRALSVDEARLLKTQDVGYVRTVRNAVAKDVKGLKERLVTMEVMQKARRGGEEEEEEEGGEKEQDEDGEEDVVVTKGKKATRKPPPAKRIVFSDDAVSRTAALDAAETEAAALRRTSAATRTAADGDEEGGEEMVTTKTFGRVPVRVLARRRTERELAAAQRQLKALATAEDALERQRAGMAKTETSSGRVSRNTGRRIKVRVRKR